MGWDGFDGVEVVMDVEDTFAIDIPNREAERLTTAGALYEYVVGRVRLARPGPDARCLSAVAFHRLRRRLTKQYGFDPAQIRPRTGLRDILPAETSHWDAWKLLGSSLGVRLRPLEHPRWLYITAICLCLSVFAVSLTLTPRGSNWSVLCVVPICLCTFLSPWLLLRLTRDRFAVHIPRGYETVGDVSSLLMHEAVAEMPAGKEQWWTHEVWEVIRCIIAKSAGIPPAWIRKETKFFSGELA